MVVADKTLIQRLKEAINADKPENIKKDNMTDIAERVTNPKEPAPQPQNGNNQPQNLEPNQVIAVDGTIIDLTQDQKEAIKKILSQ